MSNYVIFLHIYSKIGSNLVLCGITKDCCGQVVCIQEWDKRIDF